MKVNALVDEQVIDALYRASRDGVRVECLVRGICALRPGRENLSETVTVRSILGRFLEHSRVFQFQSVGEWWIGSADMMHRNLDRRIEALIRVTQPELQDQLSAMLDLAFSPRISGWELDAAGTWHRRHHQPAHLPTFGEVGDGILSVVAAPNGTADGALPDSGSGPYTIDYQNELAALTLLRSENA
jgi:polyphosphate kinase